MSLYCDQRAYVIIASAQPLSIAVVQMPHGPPRRLRCPKDRVGSWFVWEVACSSLAARPGRRPKQQQEQEQKQKHSVWLSLD